MGGLTGSNINEPNIVLRFCIIILLGVLGFGVALSWRGSLLMASEYQEMPISQKFLELKKKNQIKQQKISQRQIKK